jgi:hypothetical protein
LSPGIGRPTVAHRIVQHAVADAIAADIIALELILAHRQGKFPGHAVAVENQRVFRQPGHGAGCGIIEVVVKECLDTLIGWAEVTGEQAGFFPIALQ